MSESLWKSASSAAAAFGRFEPGPEMPPPDGVGVREYFDSLRQVGKFDEAVVFLAHLLPSREAVWWACLCLWRLERPQPASAADEALAAVLRWVLEPKEEHCQAAGVAAERAGGAATAFLAQAVAFCSASMAPPGLPVVAPPPYLCQRAIAGTLRLAAAKGGDQQLREFLAWGIDVADGKNRWN